MNKRTAKRLHRKFHLPLWVFRLCEFDPEKQWVAVRLVRSWDRGHYRWGCPGLIVFVGRNVGKPVGFLKQYEGWAVEYAYDEFRASQRIIRYAGDVGDYQPLDTCMTSSMIDIDRKLLRPGLYRGFST